MPFELNKMAIKVIAAIVSVNAMFPDKFDENGKKGTKPIKLLIHIKKNMVQVPTVLTLVPIVYGLFGIMRVILFLWRWIKEKTGHK